MAEWHKGMLDGIEAKSLSPRESTCIKMMLELPLRLEPKEPQYQGGLRPSLDMTHSWP